MSATTPDASDPIGPRDRRRSESQFQGLVEHSLVGMSIVQNDRFLYANPKFCEIFGYDRDVVLRRLSPLDLVAETDRVRVADIIQAGMQGHASNVAFSFNGKRGNGSLVEIELQGATMQIGGQPALIGSLTDVTDRNRTMSLLRESGARIKRERDTAQIYLDIAGVMMLVLDSAGRVVLINRRGCKILGYDNAKEITGKLWIDNFTPPRLRDQLRRDFGRLIADDSDVEHYENPVLTRTGGERLIAWHNVPIADDKGTIVATLSSGEDITERRLALEELRKSEERFRTIFESVPDGVYVIDAATGRFIDVNGPGCLMFGYSRTELIGGEIGMLSSGAPPFTSDGALARLEKARSGPPQVFEWHCRAKDGRLFWAEISVRCLDYGGQFVGLGTLRDITDRKAIEAELAENVAVRATEHELSPDGILVVSETGKWLSFNRRFVDMWGISDEVVKAGSDELALASVMAKVADPEAFRARVKYLYEHADDRSRDEVALLDGRTLERYSAPMRHAGGGPAGRVWFFRDITERKRAEETRAMLAAVVESSRSAIIGGDRQGRCTSWNIGAERVYGYAAKEMIGRPVAALVPKERENELPSQMATVLSGGEVLNHETVRIRKDGRLIDVSETISPIRDAAGVIVGASAIVTDISARKVTERALQKTTRALKTLSQANAALVRATDRDSLFREMCRVVVETGGYRMAWIGIAENDPQKTVRPLAHAGHEDGYLEHVRISWADDEYGRGLAGTAIRTQEVQVSQNLGNDPRMAPWVAEAMRRQYLSVIALPLRNRGNVMGVLAIYASEPDAFGAEEKELLTELGGDISYGLSALAMRTEHEIAVGRVERALEEMIQVVASTVEMRDAYTAGHQRRVAAIAEAIGREMALPEDRIHGLRLASIVHDLGKINVPAEILSKPDKLTAIEYEFIKIHPRVGYDVLKSVEFPWPIADIVLQHHERLDGSGYPSGLKGDAILIEARIIAVADVVESMTSDRPYRSAPGIGPALAEIRRGRGTLYDPVVVDACLKLVNSGRVKLENVPIERSRTFPAR